MKYSVQRARVAKRMRLQPQSFEEFVANYSKDELFVFLKRGWQQEQRREEAKERNFEQVVPD